MAGKHFDTYNAARDHLLSGGFMPDTHAPLGMTWSLNDNGVMIWADIVPLHKTPVVMLVIETDYTLGLTDVDPG